MLKLDFYKNKRQGDQNYGKIYGRVKNAEPIGVLLVILIVKK